MGTHTRGAVRLISLWALAALCMNPLPTQAQAPAPTLDPQMLAVQATAQAQQLEIDRLNQELELGQRELDMAQEKVSDEMRVARSEINVDVDKRLWPITIVAAVVAILGFGTLLSGYSKLQAHLDRLVKNELAFRLRRVDPTNVTVHVPKHGFDEMRKSLELMGFERFEPYDQVDETCLDGCVIVHFTVDPKTDSREAEAFGQFLDTHYPTLGRVGYVIYITDGIVPRDILRRYSIITYANSIVTLGANTLTVARMIS